MIEWLKYITLNDFHKKPHVVYPILLIMALTVLYPSLIASKDQQLKDKNEQIIKLTDEKNALQAEYIEHLKEDNRIRTENEVLKEVSKQKDSLLKQKVLEPVKSIAEKK